MAVKEWVKKCQPLPLYVMVTLTSFYFFVQLAVSYVTHALTLTIDSYLVLCNLIALFGYLWSIKNGGREYITETISMINACNSNHSIASDNGQGTVGEPFGNPCPKNNESKSSDHLAVEKKCTHPVSEKRLKNTFGWARIDVLFMLIGCIFFTSLCFALVMEAVQTLMHINHHDEMHHPIAVFSVGAFGLFINGLCYLLIGGYTFHQGSLLQVTSSGVVVLENAFSPSSENSTSSRHLHSRSQVPDIIIKKRQGPWEMCRDAIGCVSVMTCALVVYLTDNETAKYVDPAIAIISAVLLLFLSYPYMKESCLILLQTIPNHINIDSLCMQLMKGFPDIVNVHDFHIWQLTADKIILTVHIIFLNPKVYIRITNDIVDFFHEQGITQVTVQPEFFKDINSVELISGHGMGQCLVKCNDPECYQHYCCDMNNGSSLQLNSVEVGAMEIGTEKFGVQMKCTKKTLSSDDKSTEEMSKMEFCMKPRSSSEVDINVPQNKLENNSLVSKNKITISKSNEELITNSSDSYSLKSVFLETI